MRQYVPLFIFAFFALYAQFSTPTFSYKLEECSCGEWRQGFTSVDAKAGTIYFEAVVAPYCNANRQNFWLELRRSGSTLDIVAVFADVRATKCVCPRKAFGEIHVPPGEYTLRLIFENRYVGGSRVLDSRSVIVKG